MLDAAARRAGIGPFTHWAEHSRTDHLIYSAAGRQRASWHAPDANPDAPHLLFSVTKSITGLVAEMLGASGRIDLSAQIPDIWREHCAFSSATWRQLLDMEVPLNFVEGDGAPGDQFRHYRAAMGWDAPPEGTERQCLPDFLGTLRERDGHVGRRFQYASPTTDALGLALEAATGMRLVDLMADLVLRPAGCHGPALMTVDQTGAPRAAGGLCLAGHDLAVVGEAMLAPPNEDFAKAVQAILAPHDRTAWLAGDFPELFPDGSYRSCWYRTGDASGAFCAIGIHGQWLWCDPASRSVIVRLASEDMPESDETEQQCLALFRALAGLE